jgi:DNA-binding LacI/PurR family transcriptional regulator
MDEANNQAEPRKRIRNIAELARLAGVSAGTVSRALADKALVNAETRERIQALARAHDFRPNQMARRLRTQQAGAIGVVVPLGHERRQHLSDPFFMAMLAPLADALTESGYDIMLSRVIPGTSDWLDNIVDSGMLDGVLLIGQSDQLAAIEKVARRYRPLVVWGHQHPGQIHCAIGSDNFGGGVLATHHLLERGARRIAFLGPDAPEINQRLAGCQRAMAEAGLPEGPTVLPTHLAADLQEADISAHFSGKAIPFDGIFAASDMIAVRTLRVLADRGIAVPEAIRVIGFDDLPITMQTVPRLTTVHQDIALGAKQMVDALFRRISGEEAPSVQLKMGLVVRDST